MQLQQFAPLKLGLPISIGVMFFGILCGLHVPLYIKDIGFLGLLFFAILLRADTLMGAYKNFAHYKNRDVQAGIMLGLLLFIVSLFYKGVASKVLLLNGPFLSPQISYLFMAFCLITYLASCIIQQIFVRVLVQESLWNLFPVSLRTAGSIIGSSMIYAFYHVYLSWRMVVATFFVGLIFASVYHVRRSLMLVTVAHAVFGGACIYIMGIKFML